MGLWVGVATKYVAGGLAKVAGTGWVCVLGGYGSDGRGIWTEYARAGELGWGEPVLGSVKTSALTAGSRACSAGAFAGGMTLSHYPQGGLPFFPPSFVKSRWHKLFN